MNKQKKIVNHAQTLYNILKELKKEREDKTFYNFKARIKSYKN